MPNLEQRLIAGLEAQDWRETASVSNNWRRFGKFGRGAMYVGTPVEAHGQRFYNECIAAPCSVTGLAFSELHQRTPQFPVTGPILEQILAAGDKALASEKIDTEGLLIELMYRDGN